MSGSGPAAGSGGHASAGRTSESAGRANASAGRSAAGQNASSGHGGTGAAAGGGGARSAAGHAAIGGSAAGTGQAGTGAAGEYATNFDATESPLSEAGRWTQQGHSTGSDWTDVQSAAGLAFGTQTGAGGYDDSIALVSGFSANYRLRAVVHYTANRSTDTSTHEVELILRGSYSPHVQHLYECNLGYSGASGWYAQIMRMNGAIGEFTEIGSSQAQVPEVRDGTVFVAEISGNTINSYVDGVKVQTATDSTYATGLPGIGFFWRGTEHVDDFAFTSLTVTPL